MKCLWLFLLTFTPSISLAADCLETCNNDCAGATKLLPVPLLQNVVQLICTPKCQNECDCKSQCQNECDQSSQQCAADIFPPLNVVCTGKTALCKYIFCQGRCIISQLLPYRPGEVYPGAKTQASILSPSQLLLGNLLQPASSSQAPSQLLLGNLLQPASPSQAPSQLLLGNLLQPASPSQAPSQLLLGNLLQPPSSSQGTASNPPLLLGLFG